MAHEYAPLVADVSMSDMGYWLVTISVTPTKRLAIMIASVGITPDQAAMAALGCVAAALPARRPE